MRRAPQDWVDGTQWSSSSGLSTTRTTARSMSCASMVRSRSSNVRPGSSWRKRPRWACVPIRIRPDPFAGRLPGMAGERRGHRATGPGTRSDDGPETTALARGPRKPLPADPWTPCARRAVARPSPCRPSARPLVRLALPFPAPRTGREGSPPAARPAHAPPLPRPRRRGTPPPLPAPIIASPSPPPRSRPLLPAAAADHVPPRVRRGGRGPCAATGVAANLLAPAGCACVCVCGFRLGFALRGQGAGAFAPWLGGGCRAGRSGPTGRGGRSLRTRRVLA